MRNRCTDFKRLLEWFMLCLCSAFIVTLQLEMSFSTRISWPWYLTLVCHVMYTKVVNTKRCLGYVIKTYLRIRLQRCITIGYGNNWVTSIPAPCFCEYRACTWTRVRWNVVAIVGNMARHFPRKLIGNRSITFSMPSISKQTVFYVCHFFTHYLGVNPQDILSGAKLSKVLYATQSSTVGFNYCLPYLSRGSSVSLFIVANYLIKQGHTFTLFPSSCYYFRACCQYVGWLLNP